MYSGAQSMNYMVWLVDGDCDYMCLTCIYHDVLGDTLGFFANSVKVTYGFAVVAFFVDCWTFGSIFVCLWVPAEKVPGVVRLCGLSRFWVLTFERCSFWWTASGIEYVYLFLV